MKLRVSVYTIMSELGENAPRPSEGRDLRPGSSSRKSAHLQNHGRRAGRPGKLHCCTCDDVRQPGPRGARRARPHLQYKLPGRQRNSIFRRCGNIPLGGALATYPPSIGRPVARSRCSGVPGRAAQPPCHQPGPQSRRPIEFLPRTAGQ